MTELNDTRWNSERVWDWYSKVKPIRGCNYVPQTAINPTEMWQEATFDLETIEKELEWARQIGLNSIRIFFQYHVWAVDPEGVKDRFNQLLSIAWSKGIRTMPVLLDDVNFSGKKPYLGTQDLPTSGVHNSGWTSSPDPEYVLDPTKWPQLEQYVKDMISTFRSDERVLIWDLYNEPGNNNLLEKSLPLVEAVYVWAREMNPQQPLTMGSWFEFFGLMSRRLNELSDVVSYHYYKDPNLEEGSKLIKLCKSFERPVLCTEWLLRQDNNLFSTMLPIFERENIGWYNWGLVAGKTQTYMPWNSKPGTPIPSLWQDDLLYSDGTPYDLQEIEQIKATTSQ